MQIKIINSDYYSNVITTLCSNVDVSVQGISCPNVRRQNEEQKVLF